MIDLYYWPTGNGKKITIMLEECGLEYRVNPIDITKGDQHKPEFLKIAPNNKMPAIVDHDAEGGPLAIFESGAILMYLAEKTGKFMPSDLHGRMQVMQWLFWQVGGIGPNCGQAHYFVHYAASVNEEARHRFKTEVARLYGVLDRRLADNEYIAGSEYSIADMATWPWIYRYDWQGQDINDFPNVKRWFNQLAERPALDRGANVGTDLADLHKKMDDDDRDRLFNVKK